MKQTRIKLILFFLITVFCLGTPSVILFAQRGKETHFIPDGPIAVDFPLGVANGNLMESNQTREITEDLGIKLFRTDSKWKDVQNATGFYNYSSIDWKIGNLTAMNISLLCKLTYDNDDVETDPIGNKTSHFIARSDVPKWLDYVNRTISRYYPDNITYWEIWNEPNSDRFWDGPSSEFFYLFQETVKFIKTNFPSVFLVAPAIAVFGHSFLKQLFQQGYLQQCNAISFHIYQQYNEAVITSIYQIRDLCKLFNYTGELWITETGFPTGGNYVNRIDEKDQGDRLIKSISLSLALGVDKVFWYTFEDDNPIDNPLNSESYFGLLFGNYSYKTGACAFKFFTDYCANSTLRTDLVTLSGFTAKKNIFVFFYQQGNLTSTLVVWYRSSLMANERIKIRFDIPAVPGTVKSHTFDNSSRPFTENTVKLGYNALVLTFIATSSDSMVTIHANSSCLAIFAYFLIGIGLAFPLSTFTLKKYKPEILEKVTQKLQETIKKINHL